MSKKLAKAAATGGNCIVALESTTSSRPWRLPRKARASSSRQTAGTELCSNVIRPMTQEGGIPEMKRPTSKKTTKSRPWTREDISTLKSMVREKTKTSVIARTVKSTETATRKKAGELGVKLAGASQRKGNA